MLDVDPNGTKQGDDTKTSKNTCGNCDNSFPDWDCVFWKSVLNNSCMRCEDKCSSSGENGRCKIEGKRESGSEEKEGEKG